MEVLKEFLLQHVVVMVIAILVTLAFTSIVGYIIHNRRISRMLAEAEENAKRVLEEARKDADQLIQSAKQELKEDARRRRQKFEEESKTRRSEITKIESKIKQREEILEKKLEILDKREGELDKLNTSLKSEQQKYNHLCQEYENTLESTRQTLQKIANMTPKEAKQELMRSMEQDARQAAQESITRIEQSAKLEATNKARSVLSAAVQKLAGSYVNDATVTVITLPSDEMKGRIIGREGRNIRAIEQATGIDLIIDDIPEVVILSSFNPIRREIAKITIEKLIADGRIHPARIEETAKKVEEEFDLVVRDHGEKATFEAGITDLDPNLVELLGRLNYRTTGSQSVLSHSLEVAQICAHIASEMGLDTKLAKRIGLLHDIGQAVEQEKEGHHAEVGADICKKYGETDEVVNAIRSHHSEDLSQASPYAVVVHSANLISTDRPGARKEQLHSYIQRLEDMESKVRSFAGVEQVYIFQAGREVRVMVSPQIVDDGVVRSLSSDIAHQIRKDFSFAGQVKVTVVRENRATDFAT